MCVGAFIKKSKILGTLYRIVETGGAREAPMSFEEYVR
jgi:hypothetical protein